ncbi:MAG TPA: ribonuclease HI family protein [Spirochaetota bacterium]|nr:ribonuclease HI family protein [Spirochaetota bacterium]
MSIWQLHFDGGAVPNPGMATCGFVAHWMEGEVKPENPVIEKTWALPGTKTNNDAEYDAAVRGIETIVETDADVKEIIVYGDSQLVVNQLAGNWKIKNKKFLPYKMKVDSIRERVTVRFRHIPREYNEHADFLTRVVR